MASRGEGWRRIRSHGELGRRMVRRSEGGDTKEWFSRRGVHVNAATNRMISHDASITTPR